MNYIPGLTCDNAELYNDYITMFQSDPFSEEPITTGEQLMISISQERQNTWNTLVETTDMSKNSMGPHSQTQRRSKDNQRTLQHHC